MKYKTCSRCHETKAYGEFGKYHDNKDGRQSWCKECFAQWHTENKPRRKVNTANNRRKVKIEVLSHYSLEDYPQCTECKEEDVVCLSIDHIDGKGVDHRRVLKRAGLPFYYWLRREGFPKGYQTLCMNCQFRKRDRNKEYGRYA